MSSNVPRRSRRLHLTPARAVAAALPALALGVAAGPALASANLVTNGSFEQETLTPGGSGYTSFQLGSWTQNSTNYTGTETGWTNALSGGGPAYNFVFSVGTATALGSAGTLSLGDGAAIGNSPNGGYFFASDPVYENGSLSQTINGLVVGAPTTVSFDWGVAQQVGGAYTTSVSGDWQVSLGSSTQTTVTAGAPTQSFTGWLSATMTFVPTSTSEVLSFLAMGSGAPVFLLLDGVSLTQAVPEPASWAITLAGIVGLGVLSRRRRRSATQDAPA